ncbi:MAG TPA: hypothetical protein VL346_02075 [Acidobacteriaceae bacterium]|nr:hypothetical protein [Acidobacteriaceae bacterium]
MKAPSVRIAACLAFLLALTAPALLGAQGPGGPPHPGPGAPVPGGPGLGSPVPVPPSGKERAAPPNRPREVGPIRSAPRSTTAFGPAGRWWDDKSVIRSIGITRDQQRRMDTIFDANKSAILSSYKNFLKEQAHLDTVNKDPKADQAATFAAIDAVNNARSSLQKATAQMFLAIRHEMSSAQLEKLEKLP